MEAKGTPETAAAIWASGARIGPYVLLDRFAVGGMAEIWLARQEGLAGFSRLVVVKRVMEAFSTDPEFVDMFLNEARIAAQLSHPNIVHVLELGEHAGSYYIAMEYLNGENVATVARTGFLKKSPLPPAYAAALVAEAAAGLAHAHDKLGLDGKPLHVIHRDISPQNIVVTNEGVVKLVDFGIARASNRAALTAGTTFKGKLGYMSPEQIEGLELDARSDLFSLGIVLWEALTSTRLFLFDDVGAALAGIARGPPIEPPSAHNPAVPSELDAITLRALALPVSERYQTARELDTELLAWRKRQLVSAGAAELSAYMTLLFGDRMRERAVVLESARAGADAKDLPTRLLVSTPQAMPGGTDKTFVQQTTVDAKTTVEGGKTLVPATVVEASRTALTTRQPLVKGIEPTFVLPHLARAEPTPAKRWPAWKWLLAAGVVCWSTAGVALYLRHHEPAPETSPVTALQVQPYVPAPARAEPPQTPPPPAPAEPVALTRPTALTLDPEPAPPRSPASAGKTHAEGRTKSTVGGKLSLITSPWTRVYLGSRLLGDTPLVEVPVPSGTLQLRLVNDEKNVKSVVQVDVAPGKLTVKKLQF